jgi:hypothetical protein
VPTITVPTADPVVVTHHERALTVIAAMSPSRAYGAETNLRGWRRTVDGIDPAREDGWAFKGGSLIAGAAATLCEGTLIVTYDASWAKAKWYAGNFIAPTERLAGLYEVADGELIRRVQSVRSGWAQDLIGWLRANRPDVATFKATVPLRGRVG